MRYACHLGNVCENASCLAKISQAWNEYEAHQQQINVRSFYLHTCSRFKSLKQQRQNDRQATSLKGELSQCVHVSLSFPLTFYNGYFNNQHCQSGRL